MMMSRTGCRGRIIDAAITVLVVVAIPSCALNKRILVTSTPSQAAVFIDGRMMGRTPLTIETDDLMPNRAMDGKVSARSVVTVEKPGYDPYRVVLHEWSIPNKIHAQLGGQSLREHFEDYTARIPDVDRRTVVPSGPPQVTSSSDLDGDSQRLFASGYVLIGYAGVSGDPVASEEVRRLGTDVRAALVLVSSMSAGTITEARPVTTHTPGSVISSFANGSATGQHSGSAHASAWGPGGMAYGDATYSGTSTVSASASGVTIVPGTSRTEFVPFGRRQYDTQITFWRQRKPTRTGVHAEVIPVEARSALGRNLGAYVVAVDEGSAAFRANVVPGDVIIAAGGTPIDAPSDLDAVAEDRASGPLALDLIRNGIRQRITLAVP